jgi:EmrB/QacA subfamily drug resistance transporter
MKMATDKALDTKSRMLIIGAALLALFLGAMDALIMSAAMPTIVSELGGMHLYAWVYSAYFLARATSLPIFGKLADLFDTKNLLLFSIGLFLLSSLAAGASPSMGFLVGARVLQGIGAGGNFALVYIVLSDVAPPGKRAKTISFASSIWGIASVLGPTLGGFIVSYFSWRWIFYINVPLGIASLVGIGFYLVETREKRTEVHLDFAGVATLSGLILGLLTIFIIGGREVAWASTPSILLIIATAAFGVLFYISEKRARDPILDLAFFRKRGFAFGNGAVFFSSFAIFPLFAYAPLFIQGALGKTPMQVGVAMLSLSLGWSLGSLLLGQVLDRIGPKNATIIGALLMMASCLATLAFTTQTSMAMCFVVFQVVGLGMGFVTLATLLVVQSCLLRQDLGVSTSTHQLARTLGGTVGIGMCGGVVMGRLKEHLGSLVDGLPSDLQQMMHHSMERLFQPEFLASVSAEVRSVLQDAVVAGTSAIFWLVLAAAVLCLGCGLLLPPPPKPDK